MACVELSDSIVKVMQIFFKTFCLLAACRGLSHINVLVYVHFFFGGGIPSIPKVCIVVCSHCGGL